MHTIRNESAEAVIAPTGCNPIYFGVRAVNWQSSIEVLEFVNLPYVMRNIKSAGAPWLSVAGRTGMNQSGHHTLNGVDYVLEPARHHVLRETEFEVQQTAVDQIDGSARIDIAAQRRSDGRHRAPSRVTVHCQVTLGAMQMLLELRVRSDSTSSQLWNLGLHPYFPVDRSVDANYHVPGQNVAELHWQDQEPVPTGQKLSRADRGLAGSTLVPDNVRAQPKAGPKQIDDLFLDPAPDEDSMCGWVEQPQQIRMQNGDYQSCRVRRYLQVLDDVPGLAPLPVWQLYCPNRDAVAIEVMEHLPDAINRPGEHPPVLEAGEARHYKLAIGADVQISSRES